MTTNAKRLPQLNAFQIKIIALIVMTLDHFSVYQTFTVNKTFNDRCRTLISVHLKMKL